MSVKGSLDMIYLNYCSFKKNNYKLGLKEDKQLIDDLIKNAKFCVTHGILVSTIQEYLEVIFYGHAKLLNKLLQDIQTIQDTIQSDLERMGV